MRRTRKWAFVAQEATRLANLGLSPLEISKQLGVRKSTVTRWMAGGKLPRTGSRAKTVRRVVAAGAVQTPTEWAAAVRSTYALDATDAQLVKLAEAELMKAFNLEVSPSARSSAAGRFQMLVRQLALVARNEPEKTVRPEAPMRQAFDLPKRTSGDPRALLTAVK